MLGHTMAEFTGVKRWRLGVDQLLVDQALIAQEVLDRLINHQINRRWCRAESGGAEIRSVEVRCQPALRLSCAAGSLPTASLICRRKHAKPRPSRRSPAWAFGFQYGARQGPVSLARSANRNPLVYAPHGLNVRRGGKLLILWFSFGSGALGKESAQTMRYRIPDTMRAHIPKEPGGITSKFLW